MKYAISILLLLISYSPLLTAQQINEREVLENLLNEFLQGASENDETIHNRFWAEDLIYTSSNGERVTKQEIMDGLRNDEEEVTSSESPEYYAVETQIRLFDDMAIIAFKLVTISESPGEPERMEFYNTGTFHKRDGQWKAIAWQATRIPEE